MLESHLGRDRTDHRPREACSRLGSPGRRLGRSPHAAGSEERGNLAPVVRWRSPAAEPWRPSSWAGQVGSIQRGQDEGGRYTEPLGSWYGCICLAYGPWLADVDGDGKGETQAEQGSSEAKRGEPALCLGTRSQDRTARARGVPHLLISLPRIVSTERDDGHTHVLHRVKTQAEIGGMVLEGCFVAFGQLRRRNCAQAASW